MPTKLPQLTKYEAIRRSKSVEKVSVSVFLDVTQETEYRGQAELRFTSKTGRTTFLDYQGRSVTGLKINGKAAPLSLHAKHRIKLPKDLLKKGKNKVWVEFETPYDHDGAGLHRSVDPADSNPYLYAVMAPFDANRVVPCFDQPDLKANFELEVLAPPEWEVVANAPLAQTRDLDGGRSHRFEKTPPIPTYIFSLAAGPWASWVDPKARVPSRIFASQSLAEHVDPEELFDLTRRGFDLFESFFEIPYPFGKYDQVFCPHFNWGAMENVGVVLHSDSMIFRHVPTAHERQDRANTVLHELSHMWFGNLVTMRWWDDLWLNEAFATYMASWALAQIPGFENAWLNFRRDIKTWAYAEDELQSTHPIALEVPDTLETFSNFDGITYGKGAATLRQLETYLGEEAFQKGVAQYLKAFQFSNATLADFLGHLSEAAGRDLKAWSNAWLEKEGMNFLTLVPRFEGRRAQVSCRGYELSQARFNGDRVLRPQKLLVRAHGELPDGTLGEVARQEVTLKGRMVEFEMPLETLPHLIELDGEGRGFFRSHLSPREWKALQKDFALLTDPGARAYVWQTLWFQLRDGELEPAKYLRFVLEHLDKEPDLDQVASMAKDLKRVLDVYLDPKQRKRLAPRLFALAKARHEASEDVAEAQIWRGYMRMGALRSRDRADLEASLEVLRGPHALSQAERWQVLEVLASQGWSRWKARLAEEAERDPSDRGKAAALRVQAALPDAAQKLEVYERLIGSSDEPLGLLREGMRGLRQPGQLEVLEALSRRFFEDLPKLSLEKAHFFMDAWIPALFPLESRALEVGRSTRRILKKVDLPFYARRALQDQLEEWTRVQAMQAD